MNDDKFKMRPGRTEDASVLVELVNYAGEGLPLYSWEQMAEPGQSAWEVGLQRAVRDEGSFSFKNATIIEAEGQAAGALIGYKIPDLPEPISADMPALFVPLQELENLAPGSWYVNVLAVVPEFRNRGFGSGLIKLAETTAAKLGTNGLSIIVADHNHGARRLYQQNGFTEFARRPIVKEG